MSSEDKAKLLGLFMWLFTALNVVVVAIIGIFYIFIFGAFLSQVPQKADGPPPEMFVGILAFVFFFLFFFTVLFSVPKIVAGYGLRNHKPWARTWALIASIMCCLSFPIGTAIGVFGLVFLFGDEGKAYFENRALGQVGAGSNMPPPPPANSWQ